MPYFNDQRNVPLDYIMLDDFFSRPLAISAQPERDIYHGRDMTVLEEALDCAFFNSSIQKKLHPFKNPNTCPVDFLDALAMEHGVTEWNQFNSTKEKRELIKSSKEIHQQAGTIEGLTNAIRILGLNVLVTQSSRPYTLSFTSTQLLTPQITKAVTDRVTLYKSERDLVFFESSISAINKQYHANITMMRASYYAKSSIE